MAKVEGHGKYVSRSTFQKVAEQNKKLMTDIKILVGDFKVYTEVERRLQEATRNKYLKKFKEEKDMMNFFKIIFNKKT